MRVVSWMLTAFFLFLSSSSAIAQTSRAADLIVVVDTSGAMPDEVPILEGAMGSVAASIGSAAIDLRVIVIASESLCIAAPMGSGSCSGGDSNPPGYQHVNQVVSSTDALQQIIDTYPTWSGLLRT